MNIRTSGTSGTITRYLQNGPLADIYDRVMEGRRLGFDEGVRLWQSDDLSALGALANIVRESKNGNRTYYVRNQHINYTNVCNKGCRFCSFYAQKGGPAPYTMTPDDVRAKLERTRHIPITEIHMVAGIHPRLPYSYYLDLLRTVKETRPDAHIKAFTMVELLQIQKLAGKPMPDVLRELKAHGLDSLPGGGAEILTDRVTTRCFRRKKRRRSGSKPPKRPTASGCRPTRPCCTAISRRSRSAVIHLMKLREAQDETGGFLTFIPLAFSSKGTKLAGAPATTGYLDLKAIAIGRLMLDNFPHVKGFWMMVTPPVAQAAQWYGADDIDGTIVEYEITHEIAEKSAEQQLSQRKLVEMILEAGREPVERDPLYNVIERDDSRTLLAPERPARSSLALPMAG
jgi:aminodeoxyfutalosine synthase